jgi:hypothetical protein
LCEGGGKKMSTAGATAVMIEEEFKDLPEKYRKELPSFSEVYMAQPTADCPTGLKGRIAVVETFEMNPELEKAILDRRPEEEMFATVRKHGMLTIKEDAIIKSAKGVVPFSEVNTLGGNFDIDDIEDARDKKPKEEPQDEEVTVPKPKKGTPDKQKEIEI